MANDFIWTPNGPIPRGWWEQNRFIAPAVNYQPRPTMLLDIPETDASGLMNTTHAVEATPWVTEGTSRNQGPGEAGLGRGPADIGYSKGGATADTTTTATDNTKDFANSLAAGLLGMAMPGALTGLALGSQIGTGKGLVSHLRDAVSGLFGGNDLSGSIGQNPGGLANPGVAQVGQANDPFGGGSGLGQAPSMAGTDLVGQANDPFGGGTGLGQGGGDTGSAK